MTRKMNQQMTRKNEKTNPAGPDEHFEALGQLLTQLNTHLTGSGGKKGTYGDYLRLLQFYREAHDQQLKEIIIGWVDNDNLATKPPP